MATTNRVFGQTASERSDRPRLAILIVTYNSAGHILGCLESIFNQGSRFLTDVIVVDNNSSDNTVTLIRETYPEVFILTPGRNLGFATGVNLAASQSNAEFLLLLNPDAVLLEGALDAVVQFARSNSGYGLFGGRAFTRDGSLEPSSCWGLPTLWSSAMFATGLNTLAKRSRLFDPESLGKWERDTVREVAMISGCFLLVSRAVWSRLGGFDERYFMYGEDADLAARAAKLGYRSIVCPQARFIHDIGGSSSTPFDKSLLLYRGKAQFALTHWSGLQRWLGLRLLQAGVAVRAAGTMSLNYFGASIDKPWIDLWRQRRSWRSGFSSESGRDQTPNPQPVRSIRS